jgi:hypothetical protein
MGPFRITAVLLALGGLGMPGEAPDAAVSALEQEMAARPQEALLIARQGADRLAGRQDLIRQLFATAVRLQEKRLTALDEADVVELADLYAKTLADGAAADRVRRRWLAARGRDLGTADGRGRLRLARLWWRWLHDRDAAARLCQDALRAAPDLTAAAQMLHDDLNYRRTEAGWVAVEDTGSHAAGAWGVQPGMTAADVRKRLGPPARVARQVFYRRWVDQWLYEQPAPLCITFDGIKGGEAHVLTVQDLGSPKP